jgi:NADPH:quinone reductase-like Zn-dependent oxidoreductase
MRAVVITRHGPPEVLRVQERPDPRPGPGEVLVDVHAAGVNFADLQARVGLYPDAPKPPCVVGYEVAGVVSAVGPAVHGVREGARVMAGTRFGGYAEKVAVKAQDTVPLPDALTFEEGAAVPVCYATAWCALHRYGSLQRGERVLVHAAAGGVGIAAVQLARAAGAEIWGTASPHKHEAVREQGADHVLDYTRDDWHRDLPDFDLVLDPLGGPSHRTSFDLLRPGGRLVAFGASSVVSGQRRNLVTAARAVLREPRFNLIKQMSDSKSVIGLNMLRLWDSRGTLEPWIAPLQERLRDGTIRPVVAQAVPFDRAPEAHRLLHERRNIGKVVLTPA